MKVANIMLRWNQLLSFSPILAKSKNADWVFWPGCATMKLDPKLIHQTYKLLRLKNPELGFSSWCCGKPTLSADSDKNKEKRMQQLKLYFRRSGIRGVYALCPNCLLTLNQLGFVEALSAWPLLSFQYRNEMMTSKFFTDTYLLHDPCVSRKDADSQQSVRNLLTESSIRWMEFPHSRAHTLCCGRKNMLFLTNPEISKKMLHTRLDEAANTPIITYCESCAEAFRGGGSKAYHLLEVLYDSPSSHSLINRIKTAHLEVKHD